jgi:hypothetical protein
MHAQDSGRGHLAKREPPEGVFDRGYAGIRRKEPLDIVP